MRSCSIFVSHTHFLPPSFSCCGFNPVPSTSHKHCVGLLQLVLSQSRPHCPLLSNRGFSTAFLPPYRGASVIGALSLLCQRAAGPGQGPIRAGLCPGFRPPVCPSLRATPRTHPAPAPPGSAGQRDAEVSEQPHLQPPVPQGQKLRMGQRQESLVLVAVLQVISHDITHSRY